MFVERGWRRVATRAGRHVAGEVYSAVRTPRGVVSNPACIGIFLGPEARVRRHDKLSGADAVLALSELGGVLGAEQREHGGRRLDL